MPELPEVETTRQGIRPNAEKQTIEKIIIRNGKLRWPVPEKIATLLKDTTIDNIGRRGKYLLLQTPKGTLLIHLGMSGNLRILPQGSPVQKHDHVDIVLKNGFVIRLNDPRRFGSVLWHDINEGGVSEHKLLSKLGPEPLSDEFNSDYFYQLSRQRKMSIKSFVMNSNIVVGAGNIYANESLFLSGIHPEKLAGKLTKKQCETLVNNIKQVLAAAIEQGGTTLKDFLSPSGKPGYFVQKLNVYGRDGASCPQCGATIERIIQNQRASFFCRKCQKK
ncbi:bifunctional DNA-formamidopyrimidine glycosylase/DNA-(apurinic or apyrimidinic site) lyase [Thiomicrorhabdus sediminis]|uniref:Formamidopyrimidine-DNA glycosylase n=1 Tax=Thiomicrorhabdus sediminis TaxID=2580412 RepID=A0A4V1HI11_9GAMM|nr:bifunctional DNA-formamidopyrimidine glycosylase/DNA-(apurinic or apyrimidinic site) lyase [Thiomicrorhabdus sediminis]QCU90903.1 bifunctional DNA-formamidopyrimidine glycosylase/DNA-(apurinic or apyrimidinic site) lyase [Thiomicrorhabdus sediminis]